MKKSLISGIIQRNNLWSFMISHIDKRGIEGQILQRLAQNRINLEFISRIPGGNNHTTVILCVDRHDRDATLALLKEMKPASGGLRIRPLYHSGILSLFPHREQADVIGIVIGTFATAKIPLLAVGSSLSAISCVINAEMIPDAVKLLSIEFGLT